MEVVSADAHEHGLFDAVAEGDALHVSYGGGTVHYRHRSADGSWGVPRTVTLRGSGHTSIAALGDGHALVTWLDVGAHRVAQREVGEEEMLPETRVLDAGEEGIAGRLSINLNGLAAPAGPFLSAITATVGEGPVYRVLLATRPVSGDTAP